MAEIVSAVASKVVESLMVAVKRHLHYMIYSRRYVRELHHAMRELNVERIDVMNRVEENIVRNLQIPVGVHIWLEEARSCIEKVENFASYDVGSCPSLKMSHKVGKTSLRMIVIIKYLMEKSYRFVWSNAPVPLGRMYSMASSFNPIREDFKSREKPFMEALKALEPNNKFHMVALCGIAGVGKTVMMEKLMQVAKERRMFESIIRVVVGPNTDHFHIQETVAEYLGICLDETARNARADRLRSRFEEISVGGRKKILVILDDVWDMVDLNDIGLSLFSSRLEGFKVLLTSRDRRLCSIMGVEQHLIIDVEVLEESEAQTLFRQYVTGSDHVDLDPDLQKIGDYIASRCGGVPWAIKQIARSLRGVKDKTIWLDTLSHVKDHGVDKYVYQAVVKTEHKTIEMSYNDLNDETKSILLLCGLFPEYLNISAENLLRYGWRLKLFDDVNTISQARYRLKTSIGQLIYAKLLIGSHGGRWVRMPDLVHAFVLSKLSKGDHASIVNHGDMSEWPAEDMSESCKRISLTFKGMWKFPRKFKYPNLSLLKLMHGDNLLRDGQDFYGGMENLQLIAYERTHYMQFPTSLQCSNNLRTLCLEYCSLTFNFSFIGYLRNLEILSFAHSGILILPSIIGNLDKLKLLDLTGCVNLHIDNDVFSKLVNLEELYMRVAANQYQKAISFTDSSCKDLAQRSVNLSSLEFEFCENGAQPMNMSFEKLERFKISMGCFLKSMDDDYVLPYENKLMLVTNKGELLGSGMLELFVKTDVLYLQVSDMNDLEEIDDTVKSLHLSYPPLFDNLRFLSISFCSELKYLFTPRVAKALSKLENLRISSCPIMETLVHTRISRSETITFPQLKCLTLTDLPNLLGLCDTTEVIELPQLVELELYGLPKITSIYPKNKLGISSMPMQPLWKAKVVIGQLEKLHIENMQNLEEIWPCENTGGVANLPISRETTLKQEHSQVDVALGSLCQYLRKMDLRSYNASSSLIASHVIRHIKNLEELVVWGCDSIVEVFETKSANNTGIYITEGRKNVGETSQMFTKMIVPQLLNLKKVEILGCDRLEHLFTFSTLESLEQLKELEIMYCKNIQVIVKEEDGVVMSKVVVFPHLKSVKLFDLPNLNGFFLGANDFQWPLLEIVEINGCPKMTSFTRGCSTSPKLKYISTSFGKYSSIHGLNFHVTTSLPENHISSLDGSSSLPPILETSPWSFSNLININLQGMKDMGDLNYIIPFAELQQLEKLEKMQIKHQDLVEGVFEASERTNSGSSEVLSVIKIPNLREVEIFHLEKLKYLWKSNQWTTLEFPNLTRLSIVHCQSLGHVFSCSMVGSLLQLQELHVGNCLSMKSIVKEEEGDAKVNMIMFPSLNSLELTNLSKLEGFWLGSDQECEWPSLVTLKIKDCPEIKVFTTGKSTAPKLKVIETSDGTVDAKEDPNSFLTKQEVCDPNEVVEELKPNTLCQQEVEVSELEP
uniref:probable disease resistance protein At4g27220 n=1 Tax=Erigeron canadensis TaxID=72917 RepID=UPI001CB8F006|nr:probable disease resistance protein At4g27220 [Erigeron canadensis]